MSPEIKEPVIINRWLSFYGKESVREIQKWNKKGIKDAIRINKLKVTPEYLLKQLQKKKFILSKSSLPFGYHILSSPKFPSLGATHEYLLGFYAIQGIFSQLVPSLFTNLENTSIKVLDMTAAPGGKTSQIACLMNNKGIIIAIDSSKKRIVALRSNLARLGVNNVSVLHGKAQQLVPSLGKFDRILLDAPCCGSGSICRRPYNEWSRSVDDIKRLETIQEELLETAFQALTLNGELIYSTCSLEPEEGEEQIINLIRKYPEKLLLEKIQLNAKRNSIITKTLNKSITKLETKYLANCLRYIPNELNEGFFIAKIKRIS
ncbi:MAG: RsmB/NOP family class I SAM-dependent RNA methyltransferase [Candidatus Hodarchaeales archaeon]|jgi:NOL1/NOP2/sun family putative RNA methylase